MQNYLSKKPLPWVWIFYFWGICSVLTLVLVTLKTHQGWFAGTKNQVDGAYAFKMLNFNMPTDYSDMVHALKQGQPIPAHFCTYFDLADQFLPQDFAGHYLNGLCHQSHGEWQQADASYRRALAVDPYFFWAYYNLGGMYAANGHPEIAAQFWRTGVALQPELTLKALVSTKLLADCLRDPVFNGYDPADALRKGYEHAVHGEYIHPVLF